MQLGFWGWVWLIAFVIIGVTALGLYGGLITQAQVETVAANLSDSFVYVATAVVMKNLALPVIVVAAFLLVTHGRGMAGRVLAGGIIFAVVAGLVHFGAWNGLKANGDVYGHVAGNLWQRIAGLGTR